MGDVPPELVDVRALWLAVHEAKRNLDERLAVLAQESPDSVLGNLIRQAIYLEQFEAEQRRFQAIRTKRSWYPWSV